MDTEGKWEGGANWEIRINIRTRPCVKETASRTLLYSIGNSAPGSVMTQRVRIEGWEGGLRERGCVCECV